MKATDFNLKKEIKISFKSGEITFKNNRFLVIDTNTMGAIRYNLIEHLGKDSAKALLLKFGYINGYSDFMEAKIGYEFDNETELLSVSSIMQTWKGITKAEIKKLHFNRDKGEFYAHGIWTNSFECEQHLTYYEVSSEAACWMLAGYSSGWYSAFFGSKVIAIETLCTAKGDDHCECEIKTPEAWNYKLAKPYIEALKEF